MRSAPATGTGVLLRSAAAIAVVCFAVSGCRNAGAAEARADRASCDDGEAAACVRYADRLAAGDQVLEDPNAAAERYAMACDAGGAPVGCVRLATMHLDRSAGVQPSRGTAEELLRRGCDGGDLPGCVVLAETFMTSRDARPVLENACAGGESSGCLHLGELLAGLPGAENRTRAAELFRDACAEQAEACIRLADAYLEGVGVAADTAAAFERLDQACRTSPRGCFRTAALYEEGVGVEADPDRAVGLYETACYGRTDGGGRGEPVGEACYRMADLLATGDRVERDLNRAARTFSRACRLGYEDACRR